MSGSDEPRRRTDADDTTRRLLDAAAMEFMENGYDKAVISDIARRAGLTTGAVYARWPHKSDVMVAALDHIFDRLLPEQRVRGFGVAGSPTADIVATWGAALLDPEEMRNSSAEVLVQVFGSARNNEAIQERLRRFLTDQADQLSQIVEKSKDEGFSDPELSTVAITLLCQAIGIGTHLLISAGREDRQVPPEHEWAALLLRVLGTAAPQEQ